MPTPDHIHVDSDRIPIVVPGEGDFGGEYLPANELQSLLRDLLSTHARFCDFQDLEIDLLWKEKGGVSKGNATLAKITAVSGLTAHYTKNEFIIWLAADHLGIITGQHHLLPRRLAEALLYHELCHLKWDAEEGCAVLQGHEFEGFYDELTLYGDVRAELRQLRTVAQLPLFGETVQ